MLTQVIQTKKHGLEIWVVVVGGQLHSTHMSREVANTKALQLKVDGEVKLG